MDANLVDLSHKISKETPGATPKLATKSVSFPEPPAKAKKAAKAEEKQTKEEKKEAKEDEGVELRRKVKAYLGNPKFGEMLAEVKEPGPKASDVEWKAAYEHIAEVMKASYKELMVRTMFDSGCKAAETVMVQFLQMEAMQGVGAHMTAHRDKFEPELTEIAIELSNSWVPGPVPRLVFKMFNELQEFGRLKGGKKAE